MEQNKEDLVDNMSKTNEIDKKSSTSTHPILLFFVFILIINQFNKKSSFDVEKSEETEDEFTVTMGKNPAFPLERNASKENTEKKSVLKLENPQEIFNMVDRVKPYMSEKNRHVISIFERWKDLMEDMNRLSDFHSTLEIQSSSSKDPSNVVNFLYDLKPFIHEDYHSQIHQFSDGMKNMMEIQKNINNLQSTFSNINHIKDNSQKVNNLIDAVQPFMAENKKKTVSQIKNFSQMMDMMKMAESFSQSSNQSPQSSDEAIHEDEKSYLNEAPVEKNQDKKSNLMDLLDILDSPPTENANTVRVAKNDIPSPNTENVEDDFEEIFEESDSFEDINKEQKDQS